MQECSAESTYTYVRTGAAIGSDCETEEEKKSGRTFGQEFWPRELSSQKSIAQGLMGRNDNDFAAIRIGGTAENPFQKKKEGGIISTIHGVPSVPQVD